MLTGTIPPTHNIRGNLDQRLADSDRTIAEILAEDGYVTSAVIGSYVLDSTFGLDQGFDYYLDDFELTAESPFEIERRGEEVTRHAIEWLDSHRSDGFFMFVHYYDPHHPYEPPEPFKNRFGHDLYAGEVSYTDHCIGKLLDRLKELELYESSLIVVVGDHGEMLGEHGEEEHMYFIYENAIRVPLIFKLPHESEAAVVHDAAGIIDIVPTICGILGIESPAAAQGHDLSPLFAGDHTLPAKRYVYCESMYATRYGANPLWGVVTNGWKYIHTTRPELYDLTDDPAETNNLFDDKPDLADSLREQLTELLGESAPIDAPDTRVTLDSESRAKLRSLGYIGSSGGSRISQLDPALRDPKDLVDFHSLTLKADELILDERYEEARRICEKMLEADVESFDTHHFMAKIAQAEGNTVEAITHLEEAIRIQPDEPRLQYELANALMQSGRDNEALEHLQNSLRLKPWSDEARVNVGIVLANQGRLREAQRLLQEALELNPESARAHYELGCVLDRTGNTREAIQHYTRALAIEPTHADAHNNLGVALARQGSLNAAITHFAEALKFEPEDQGIQNNLRRAMSIRANN
jgi:Flp pilus assembly protein TadD